MNCPKHAKTDPVKLIGTYCPVCKKHMVHRESTQEPIQELREDTDWDSYRKRNRDNAEGLK